MYNALWILLISVFHIVECWILFFLSFHLTDLNDTQCIPFSCTKIIMNIIDRFDQNEASPSFNWSRSFIRLLRFYGSVCVCVRFRTFEMVKFSVCVFAVLRCIIQRLYGEDISWYNSIQNGSSSIYSNLIVTKLNEIYIDFTHAAAFVAVHLRSTSNHHVKLVNCRPHNWQQPK